AGGVVRLQDVLEVQAEVRLPVRAREGRQGRSSDPGDLLVERLSGGAAGRVDRADRVAGDRRGEEPAGRQAGVAARTEPAVAGELQRGAAVAGGHVAGDLRGRGPFQHRQLA